MNILFLSDDPDEATIFLDTIFEINPEINCTIMSSNEDLLSALKELVLSTVFLDYNNLPEPFVKNSIKDLHNNKHLSKVRVVIYASPHFLTRRIREKLINMGIRHLVLKTSDLVTLRKSIADSLK